MDAGGFLVGVWIDDLYLYVVACIVHEEGTYD